MLLHPFIKVEGKKNTGSTFSAKREGNSYECFSFGDDSICVYGYQGMIADPEDSWVMEIFTEDILQLLNSLVLKKAICYC